MNRCAEWGLLRFRILRTDLSWFRLQFCNTQQVVGGPGKVSLLLDTGEAFETGLSQPGDGLEPAKDFIDSFALTLTDQVRSADRRQQSGVHCRRRDLRDAESGLARGAWRTGQGSGMAGIAGAAGFAAVCRGRAERAGLETAI